MSRGDFGSSTNYYKPGYQEGDSEYIRLSNAVSNNVQSMTKNVAAIQRLTNKIGTSSDVPELLEDLQEKQMDAHRIAKETANYLKQLGFIESGTPQEQKQRKLQQEKLRDNFSDVLGKLQKAQRLAAEKEKASVQRARAASVEYRDYEGKTEPLGQQGGPSLQVQTEADLSLEEIREREEAIRKLESDIIDVNDIFKDLALMVHEQGDIVDSIEANVGNAAANIEEGNVQLEKARDYQKASRRKLCCLVVILLVVAAIIGIIIWQTTN
ncbi:syntaxin-7-like [Rhopilema esculentum]|uniref:syntaxin-7-like n=1 Tax=Rhopilema esculentum TaxID=499914 RepID=UPI0031DC993C